MKVTAHIRFKVDYVGSEVPISEREAERSVEEYLREAMKHMGDDGETSIDYIQVAARADLVQ